jgi:rhamnosyltransferase
MNQARVAAIVVLFHPDTAVLSRLLTSLAPQVHKIFVMDNTPGAVDWKPPRLQCETPFSYHSMGANQGIATAQNRGIKLAKEEEFSHVLLMDQDSQPQPEMVANLLSAEADLLARSEKVAVVGPVFIDEKTHRSLPVVRHFFLSVRKLYVNPGSPEPAKADYLISSGALIRLSVLDRIGGMRDELFIDWVDIEWGLRARANGYQSYMVPMAIMKHNLGDATTRVLSRHIYLHSDIRNYYIVRNATYLLSLDTMGWRWRSVTLLKIPQYIVFYSIHSNRHLYSFRLLCRAVLDGVAHNMGAFR